MENFTIPNWHLFLGAILCFALGLLSLNWQLKLFRSISLAIVRSLLQLMAFGYILKLLFSLESWWPPLIVCLFMTIFAAITIKGRLPQRKMTNTLILFLNLLLCGGLTGLLLIFLMDGKIHFTANRYIPLMGMLLGNSLNGITLGLQRVQEEMKDKKDQVKTMLGLGASIEQATHSIFKSAMNSSITPIINTMLVVGLVNFPGLMTGKVLAGADPIESAKAQFIIIASIFICIFLSSILGVKIQIKKYFEKDLYFNENYS